MGDKSQEGGSWTSSRSRGEKASFWFISGIWDAGRHRRDLEFSEKCRSGQYRVRPLDKEERPRVGTNQWDLLSHLLPNHGRIRFNQPGKVPRCLPRQVVWYIQLHIEENIIIVPPGNALLLWHKTLTQFLSFLCYDQELLLLPAEIIWMGPSSNISIKVFSFWRTHWHWPAESHWWATTKKGGFLAPCGSTLGRRLEAQRVAYSRPQLAEWTRVARIRGARKNAKISEIQRLPSPCWSADSCDPSLCAGRLPSAGMLRPLAGRTVTTNKVWQGVGWGAVQVRRSWPNLVSWCNRGRGWKTFDQRFSPSWKCGGDEFYLSWGLAVIVSPERKEGENLRVAFTELTQIHRAGCLKKSKFYRIEHLQAATGGSSLRIVFCRFSLKTKRDQSLLSHIYGKIWLHSIQFWL